MVNELKKHHLRSYHQRFTPPEGCKLESLFPVASDEIVIPFKIEKINIKSGFSGLFREERTLICIDNSKRN